MAKKRKTRRQKMESSTRRNYLDNSLEIITNTAKEFKPAIPSAIEPKTYTYVAQDIRRTILVLAVVTALNIILYIFLKLKIISLFGLIF